MDIQMNEQSYLLCLFFQLSFPSHSLEASIKVYLISENNLQKSPALVMATNIS